MPPPEEADDTDSEIEHGPEDEGDEPLGDELVALEGEEDLDDEEDDEEDDALGKSRIRYPITARPCLTARGTPAPKLAMGAFLLEWNLASHIQHDAILHEYTFDGP